MVFSFTIKQIWRNTGIKERNYSILSQIMKYLIHCSLNLHQESKNKRGHPHREWTDDIVEWCGESLQELRHLALDQSNWQKMGVGLQRTLTEPMTCDDDDEESKKNAEFRELL